MTASGYIYAIGVDGSPGVKIGCTRTAVAKRLAQLQTGHAEQLTLFAAVEVREHLFAVEDLIHRALVAHQLTGEWFACTMTPERLSALVTQAQATLSRTPATDGEDAIIDDILAACGLSTSQKMLLIVLASLPPLATGGVPPSLRRLAQRSSLALSTVCTLLKDLTERGYLTVQRRHGHRQGNDYRINRARLAQADHVREGSI